MLCGRDVTVVGRPSNFVQNKLNKVNNKKKCICLHDAVPEFFSNPHNDCSLSEFLVDTSNFLGNYCEKVNINFVWEWCWYAQSCVNKWCSLGNWSILSEKKFRMETFKQNCVNFK